jgi:hypothetical protein
MAGDCALALHDRQPELLAHARAVREIGDPDKALGSWLEALQDYLRTFNGLPAPVLAAVKEWASPLALSCETLVSITGEFLTRVQDHGRVRSSVTANQVFLSALGIAWVLDRVDAYGTTRQALEDVFAHGYLDNDRDRRVGERG